MKYLFGILLSAFFGSFLLSSCTHKEDKELATLDTFNIFIKKADSLYATIDYKKLNETVISINEKLKLIDQKYNGDTISKETALIIENYKGIGNVLTQFYNQSKKLEEEIEESEKQIADLRHDIEKNIVKEEKMEEYVEREKEALQEVCTQVQLTQRSIGLTLVDYESMIPKIEQLLKNAEIKE